MQSERIIFTSRRAQKLYIDFLCKMTNLKKPILR